MNKVFLSTTIDCDEIRPGLWIPRSWRADLDSLASKDTFLETAASLAATTEKPWIVSSLTQDLQGRPRTESDSHMLHFAADVAPMYSDDEILPEDPPLSCLAANILFLSILSRAILQSPLACICEGDHLHILCTQKPQELDRFVLAVPTISSAYSLSSYVKDEWIQPLLFDPTSCTLSASDVCGIPGLNGISVLRKVCQLQDMCMNQKEA